MRGHRRVRVGPGRGTVSPDSREGSLTLIEALTVKLGASLIKAMAKLWFRDSEPANSVASGVGDLFQTKFKDWSERRAAEKLFSHVQDEVAARLETVINVEFSRLADNDRE